MSEFDAEALLPILCCPVSRKPLRLVDGQALLSTDPEVRLLYPIHDGIPVLLEEEAETLDQARWQELMDRTAEAGASE